MTRDPLAQFLHDHDAGPDAARRSKQRQRELVIANYLQRYCLKNDTIGFFGPVGRRASADPGAAGLVVRPGEQVIARRSTYFEVWAIDKVAAEIARRGRVLGWLRPRRTRSVFVAGNAPHRPHRGPVTLTGAELRVLAACDGRRTVSEVLGGAGGPGGSAVLARLAGLGALRLDLLGPIEARPERTLRAKLTRITDPAVRDPALAKLDSLIAARDRVAAAAGDEASLTIALAELNELLRKHLTTVPGERRPGETYAGRTLVYEDTVLGLPGCRSVPSYGQGAGRPRSACCWTAPAGWSPRAAAGLRTAVVRGGSGREHRGSLRRRVGSRCRAGRGASS